MKRIVLLLSVVFLASIYSAAPVFAKERVFLLTDIGNEPDDQMSLVRFLVYANQWDVEGLVATTSTHQMGKVFTARIRELVDAYGLVRDNLELHEKGFPTADALRAVIAEGPALYGMLGVGKGWLQLLGKAARLPRGDMAIRRTGPNKPEGRSGASGP
jgi:hypothetical protein